MSSILLQTLSQGWHFTSFFGLIVGWLLITYGVVIWGAHAYDHIPSRYGLMFAGFGFGLLLFNSRVLVSSAVVIMFLRFLGHLFIAIAATIAFMWLRDTELAIPTERTADPDRDDRDDQL